VSLDSCLVAILFLALAVGALVRFGGWHESDESLGDFFEPLAGEGYAAPYAARASPFASARNDDDYAWRPPRSWAFGPTANRLCAVLSNLGFCGGLAIPLHNYFTYRRVKRYITGSFPRGRESPQTFNGRPGAGADLHMFRPAAASGAPAAGASAAKPEASFDLALARLYLAPAPAGPAGVAAAAPPGGSTNTKGDQVDLGDLVPFWALAEVAKGAQGAVLAPVMHADLAVPGTPWREHRDDRGKLVGVRAGLSIADVEAYVSGAANYAGCGAPAPAPPVRRVAPA
jgi:hypothetical protein